MFQIGDKLTKENYTQGAIWCNENNAMIEVIGGEYVIVAAPEPEPLTYSELRQQEYPSIAEQLDMLYWDKVNGTNTWQEKIAEVKSKYPKEAVVSEMENTAIQTDYTI